MIDHIYIERELADHPQVAAIRARFPAAAIVTCDRYTEVFNPKAQNFRLQKRNPALILARKHGDAVLPAPPGYGVGGARNFYFSHMLNCVFDCRYCFLQGMYRSAHYVLFLNFDDFSSAMDNILQMAPGQPTWFFSGYDCDSLALEPITGFMARLLPFFASRPDALLEIRTKSVQIRTLLRTDALANVVVAFSFTPAAISRVLEHRVPPVTARLRAMRRLQDRGWRLGLRFDPLIYCEDFRAQYRALFHAVFAVLDVDCLHSVSLGALRLPRPFFRNLRRLYPDEPLFAGPLADAGGMVSYPAALDADLTDFCRTELLRYVPEQMLYSCHALG